MIIGLKTMLLILLKMLINTISLLFCEFNLHTIDLQISVLRPLHPKQNFVIQKHTPRLKESRVQCQLEKSAYIKLNIKPLLVKPITWTSYSCFTNKSLSVLVIWNVLSTLCIGFVLKILQSVKRNNKHQSRVVNLSKRQLWFFFLDVRMKISSCQNLSN